MDTGVDSASWAQIPAGEFFLGEFKRRRDHPGLRDYGHQCDLSPICRLPQSWAAGSIKVKDNQIVGYYPGDTFRGVKHEEPIENLADWLFIPLNDPSQRIKFDGAAFSIQPGYENHPIDDGLVVWGQGVL